MGLVNRTKTVNIFQFCGFFHRFGEVNVANILTAATRQESRAVARKPRDAAAVLFGLKFADNIRYNFKSSKASKARLQAPNIPAQKRI